MSQKSVSDIYQNGLHPTETTTVQQTEVVAKAKRRSFSAAYKLRIVEEADRSTERGQIGALLRREGLYSSQLATWRRQRDAGGLQALGAQKRGRKATRTPQAEELAALRRENERLQKQLLQAELIISAQKKLAAALEQTLTDNKEKS